MGVPRRFDNTISPKIWGNLLPEMWSLVLDCGYNYEFKSLPASSKWFRNLYWDYRTRYNITSPSSEAEVIRILGLGNPDFIRHVWIERVPITYRTLEYLSEEICTTKLLFLYLRHTDITDFALGHISKLLSLRSLTINDCKITDSGTVGLSSLTNLIELTIEKTLITDQTLTNLSALTKLEKLTISYIPSNGLSTSFEGLKPLIALTSLTLLSPITTPGLQSISELPLKVIKICHPNGMDQDSIAEIDKITTLEELHIYDFPRETKYSVANLRRLTNLTLRETSLKDRELFDFVNFSGLVNLDISRCPYITDQGLEAFIDTVIELERPTHYIKIEGCLSLDRYQKWGCVNLDGPSRVAWRRKRGLV